jgi:hypothetical protein
MQKYEGSFFLTTFALKWQKVILLITLKYVVEVAMVAREVDIITARK